MLFKQCILILKFISLHFTKDILELAVTVLSLRYYWQAKISTAVVQGNGDRGISETFLPLCLFSRLSQVLLLTTKLWGKKTHPYPIHLNTCSYKKS